MKNLRYIIYTCLCMLLVSSCSFFDADPDDFVSSEDNYQAKTNIYADFMGLLGTVQDVADDLIFVSELRGDLVEPTSQAPTFLQDIHNFTVTEDNELANPAKYYKIVMNTNDFLRNTVEYNTKYPGVLETNTYRQMIGGAVCIRTWAYLTLAKLYGGALYYDYSMISEEELAKAEYMDFDRLIDELIYFMNTGVDRVNGIVNVLMDEIFDVSGVQWRRMSISPDFLLTELYLWDNNPELAAKRGINMVLNKGVLGGGSDDRFVLSLFSGDSWANIYGSSYVDNHNNEGITTVFYNYQYQQTHDLQNYFDYTKNYWLAPTDRYIALFDYSGNGNVDLDSTPRLSSVISYGFGNTEGGDGMNMDMVMTKFSNLNSTNDNFIFIHRSGELHLMIAEALAATGRFDAADALINEGADDYHQTGTTYHYPFNAPIWSHNKTKFIKGVRGRAGESTNQKSVNFLSTEFKAIANMEEEEQQASPLYQDYYDRRKYVIDSIIADETGRELGFEGQRWFTLLRLARNNNDPDILAVPVSKKYPADEQASMLRILRDENNWFLDDGIKK